MKGEVAIEVKHLKAGYGDRLVLENICFNVWAGEVFAILGRSGSGKSTLLKHLIGLHAPLAGEVRIEGQSLVAAQGKARGRLLRRFGVLFQGSALFGSMTVMENVRLPLDEFTDLPLAAKELIALAKLNVVGLAAAARRLPAELSGGMQKRAAIARAIALDPGIVFLDEPTSGLDPVTAAGLDGLIQRLSRAFGITFVMITHELQRVYAVAQRAILLGETSKTIIAEGTPAELCGQTANAEVRRFFHPELV
jgi:phospholipid/cholesterol/gamma-HCH transport system ATP-binding protein